MSAATLEPGDCREVMLDMILRGEQFDAVVTDPPYDLVSVVKRFGKPGSAPAKSDGATGVYARASAGFMGKAWDGTGIAFDPKTWELALELLKPGGYLLAFGGTRTWHRQAVAIEDAGFEIRDCLMWLYGTGFPKSHDVSKGIDKAAGVERPVIGTRVADDIRGGGLNHRACDGDAKTHIIEITVPATPEAARWQGWGTALKPAWEPIIMARKPLGGRTVVDNVLQFGTGALNIDACRVETDDKRSAGGTRRSGGIMGASAPLGGWESPPGLGRWPANVIWSKDEDEYELRADVTADQKRDLFRWLHENT